MICKSRWQTTKASLRGIVLLGDPSFFCDWSKTELIDELFITYLSNNITNVIAEESLLDGMSHRSGIEPYQRSTLPEPGCH